jgi:hypothetical protein
MKAMNGFPAPRGNATTSFPARAAFRGKLYCLGGATRAKIAPQPRESGECRLNAWSPRREYKIFPAPGMAHPAADNGRGVP